MPEPSAAKNEHIYEICRGGAVEHVTGKGFHRMPAAAAKPVVIRNVRSANSSIVVWSKSRTASV